MTGHAIQHSSLEEEGRHILEECRVLAVGVQALLGFQLLSILTPALYERLDQTLRMVHLSGIVLVVVSMFLLLAPAAYHRLAESSLVSAEFIDSAASLLGWAMATLRLGLVLEVYTAARALGLAHAPSAWLGAGLFLASWGLWSLWPRLSVMRLAPNPKSD